VLNIGGCGYVPPILTIMLYIMGIFWLSRAVLGWESENEEAYRGHSNRLFFVTKVSVSEKQV